MNYEQFVHDTPEVVQEEVVEVDDLTSPGCSWQVNDVPSSASLSVSSQSYQGPKRKKNRTNETEPLLQKAQGILESVSSRLGVGAAKSGDSTNDDFGKYLASELSKIKSEKIALHTKHKLMTVLMEARMEELENN